MRGTAASQQSPPSWGADICPHQHVNVSNTPAGLPAQLSSLSGSFPSPFLYPGYSDATSAAPVSSPNYFGIVVDNSINPPDSSPGPYTKKNWDALSQTHSSVPSPRHQTQSPNPVLKQILQPKRSDSRSIDKSSEENPNIAPQNLALDKEARDPTLQDDGDSSVPPCMTSMPTELSAQAGGDKDSPHVADDPMLAFTRGTSPQQIQNPRKFSPDSYRSLSHPSSGMTHSSGAAGRNPSLSLPLRIAQPSGSISPTPRRAETLPVSLDREPVNFISAEKCAELLETVSEQVLLLDIRPYPQFSQANIHGSLNLCIPTTLLKRPSFNTEKLKDTFVGESEKQKFASWRQSTYIIVYDSNTEHPRDAALLTNVLKKFTAEGWHGQALILRGGFATFASRFPNRIRKQQDVKEANSTKQPRSMSLSLPSVAPVAGGCSLPDSSATAPFFSNIRQNMDLMGGVGQIPVKLPGALTESKRELLPSWLRIASDSKDRGQTVSERFLKIEERELERMREALSPDVSYDKTGSNTPSKKFRVAGIEKGSKNRYNDIYPFDHSRVRLQDVPLGGCDYVNANHIKAEYTNKSYIATQAPIPDTFTVSIDSAWKLWVILIILSGFLARGLGTRRQSDRSPHRRSRERASQMPPVLELWRLRAFQA